MAVGLVQGSLAALAGLVVALVEALVVVLVVALVVSAEAGLALELGLALSGLGQTRLRLELRFLPLNPLLRMCSCPSSRGLNAHAYDNASYPPLLLFSVYPL